MARMGSGTWEDALVENAMYMYDLVMWVMGTTAVCMGVLVNCLLLMHILTEKKENFKPRSVLYFLVVSLLIFMYFVPPATELKDVIF